MPDAEDGSITRWMIGVKGGDLAAAQPLWERYFARMVELARVRLRASGPGRRQRRGRCRALRLRQPLRGVGPGTIPPTGRPRRPLAAARGHHHAEGPGAGRGKYRQKRGGGLVRAASEFADNGDGDDDDLLSQAVGSEPTPEFAVMVAEEYRRLLDRLDDDVLRKVAVFRMEGYTTDAIADQLGCARRTVARQLALIRRILDADSE